MLASTQTVLHRAAEPIVAAAGFAGVVEADHHE